MNLSKAFDCIPNCLIIAKLKAYGFTNSACSLIVGYLQCRQQRVKVGHYRSEWETLKKGVPQESNHGPTIFNIFINDLFTFIDKCSLYNYADDNTIVFHHQNPNVLKTTLEKETNDVIKWFINNGMQANPTNFPGY